MKNRFQGCHTHTKKKLPRECACVSSFYFCFSAFQPHCSVAGKFACRVTLIFTNKNHSSGSDPKREGKWCIIYPFTTDDWPAIYGEGEMDEQRQTISVKQFTNLPQKLRRQVWNLIKTLSPFGLFLRGGGRQSFRTLFCDVMSSSSSIG